MDYQQQALDFAEAHDVKLNVIDYWYGTMPYWGDGVTRCIFTLLLTRDHKRYTFQFGQSIAKGSEKPTMYDVLACLTKYDPGYLADFCAEFDYKPTKQNIAVYDAVCKEYRNVERLFGDILDELCEIQ